MAAGLCFSTVSVNAAIQAAKAIAAADGDEHEVPRERVVAGVRAGRRRGEQGLADRLMTAPDDHERLATRSRSESTPAIEQRDASAIQYQFARALARAAV